MFLGSFSVPHTGRVPIRSFFRICGNAFILVSSCSEPDSSLVTTTGQFTYCRHIPG